jgi:hypothetical protein
LFRTNVKQYSMAYFIENIVEIHFYT